VYGDEVYTQDAPRSEDAAAGSGLLGFLGTAFGSYLTYSDRKAERDLSERALERDKLIYGRQGLPKLPVGSGGFDLMPILLAGGAALLLFAFLKR
jgi:hypothetical protein